jgi:hypothetical protein
VIHRRRWVRRHTELSREDRAVLTGQILPGVRDEVDGADVLFVGVDWYTAEYPRLFPVGNLVTLDVEHAMARYGSARHVTADVRDLDAHFDVGSLAAIVCNGVLGYGVNSPEDVCRALTAMSRCLRPGGHLVVGWNDIDGRRVSELQQAAATAGLEPSPGAGLSTAHSGPIGPLRHVYDVFRKVTVATPGAHRA